MAKESQKDMDFSALVALYKKEYPEVSDLDDMGKQYRALAWYTVSRGNITESCLKAAVSKTNTWYGKWMKDDAFKRILEDIKLSLVSDLEADLFNLCKTNVTALIFALTNLAPTKWKDRRNVDLNVKDMKLSDEQIAQMDSFLEEAKENNAASKEANSEVREETSEAIST